MTFYFLIIVAGCVPLIARFMYPDQFTVTEVVTHMLVGVVVAFAGWHIGLYAKSARTEIWNGEVTSVYSEHVDCTHDYKCRCREVTVGKGKDKHTETQCDTCYRHAYDVDWRVASNVGNLTIPRIDSRGLYAPPRWKLFAKGQPMAIENTYTNYVAAQQSSLFHRQLRDMANLPDVPAYPRVFDYQYANRVLPVNVVLADLPQWQADLANSLKELGPVKQANVIIVIAATADQQYRTKVEAAWEGANKNDIVVVVGVQPDDLKIIWADVITFAGNIGNETLRVELRNALLDAGVAERTKVMPIVTDMVRKLYERPHMKDFDYLAYSIEPATWYQILFGILYLIMNGGLLVLFRKIDFNLLGGKSRTS